MNIPLSLIQMLYFEVPLIDLVFIFANQDFQGLQGNPETCHSFGGYTSFVCSEMLKNRRINLLDNSVTVFRGALFQLHVFRLRAPERAVSKARTQCSLFFFIASVGTARICRSILPRQC